MRTLTNSKMNWMFLVIMVVALMSCGTGSTGPKYSDTPTSGSITISVDETLMSFMESEVSTFCSIYTNATVKANYRSEGDCFKDLINDSSRLIIAARPLTADEKKYFESVQLFPRTTRIAKDAIAIILNKSNPDSLLLIQEVKDIFTGKFKKWGDLDQKSSIKKQDINIVFDNNNSSTIHYIIDSVNLGAKFPANTFTAKSNNELIDFVSKNANAIGIIGVSWISDTNDPEAMSFLSKIRVVSISKGGTNTDDYYKPFQAYIHQGQYPLCRNVYIISREARAGLGTGFSAFVAGDKGQRIILKSGLVPAIAPVRLVEIK